MTAADVAVETQPQKIEGEKKNVFERVKLRFSSRSKKQKIAKGSDTTESMQEISLTDKTETDINEKTEKKSTGIEKVKEILKKQQKEEKKEEESPQTQKETCNGNDAHDNEAKVEEPTNAEENTEEKKKSSTLVRVKERLSMRKNKKSKDKSNDSSDKKSSKDEKLPKTEANEPEEKLKEENVKTETFVQRILKLFRSKKKQKTSDENPESKVEAGEDSKSDCDISDEDKEILAITGDKDETDTPAPTIPQITTTKPPLPVGRRLPSSATTSHTRPMSQLDDALKQFRMSTAASRENLRNSRQNLDQMEEQVKVMIRSRPATPLLSLRREEDSSKQISSSLQDLRS